MAKKRRSFEIILNPAGFIEEKYIGRQTAADVVAGVKKLDDYGQKLRAHKKPVLILIDITELGSTDLKTRVAGINAMKTLRYKRAAMYGSLSSQVLVNTLAMVAGKQNKVCAFSSRAEAIAWLQEGGLSQRHETAHSQRV